MKKTILILFATLIAVNVCIGQSIEMRTLLINSWYACVLKSIQINDTATFYNNDSLCKSAECLFIKWEINNNGKLKSGWQQGCGDSKIGYGFKKIYKWKLYEDEKSIIFIKPKIIEKYRIILLQDKALQVIRIE